MEERRAVEAFVKVLMRLQLYAPDEKHTGGPYVALLWRILMAYGRRY